MNRQEKRLSLQSLRQYSPFKRLDPSYPLLISIDCDRTIVNRKRGSHYLSPRIINALLLAEVNPKFKIVFNTGRDFTNFFPIKRALSSSFPCLFVGGRILYCQNELTVDSKACLPPSFLNALLVKMTEGVIPFLDIKHRLGNTFLVHEEANCDYLIGHHRPQDWYHTVPYSIKRASSIGLAECLYNLLDIVRVEIPFVHSLASLFLQKLDKQKEVEKELFDLFNLSPISDLMILPVLTHPTRPHIASEVVSIRVMKSNQIVNKGTGLRWIQTLYNIPSSHVVMIGDSAESTANDVIVKTVIPEATLIVPIDAKTAAKEAADFLIPSVDEDGVAEALDLFAAFFSTQKS